MSWFQKIIPPKIKRRESAKKVVPEGLWSKCPSCEAVLYAADLENNAHVCPQCGHHQRIGARKRLDMLLDEEGRVEVGANVQPVDMLKFKDSSGNWSTGMASFVPSEALLSGYSTVGTSTQHPGFTGTKTNTAVLDGALRLESTATITSMPGLVSAWPKLSALGGISGSGSYAFDTYLDLATVAARRFEATITAQSFDSGDLIGFRDLVSTWDSVVGTEVNDCDATLWIATTADDPAGSPAWGAWTPFFVGDFTCRAAKFRLDLASGSPTHNIAVSALSVRARVQV